MTGNGSTKHEIRLDPWFMGLFGEDEPIRSLYGQIHKVAACEAPVLICGASGPSNTLVAAAIHKMSRRSAGQFVKVNCRTLSQSLLEREFIGRNRGAPAARHRAATDLRDRFEAADNGTLFLDEIGDLPMFMQAELQWLLEEKVVKRAGDPEPVPVDIRLISGTTRDLPDLILKNRFREELYYQINSIFLQMAP